MTPAGVVTVADLLSRNAAVTTKLPVVTETATTGVSVGSLLRREGRAPHTVDRPVQPRAHQQIDPPKADVLSDDAADDEAPAAKKTAVKRGAVAAGALLAVGSVIGAAALTEVAPTGTEAQGATINNSYPGQGRLNASQPAAPVLPAAGVVDSGAAGGTLDAGTAPPTSWVPVAFPSAVAGVPAGIAGASGATDTSASGTAQNSSTGTGGSSASGATGERARSGSTDGSNSAPSTAANGATAGAESGGTVKDLGDGLGNTVQGVGGALPDAVGDPVEGLGGAVKDTGSALDNSVTSLLRSDDSDKTSAPQQADEESSSNGDDDSRNSRGDDDRNDDSGSDDGGSNSRGGDSGKSSGGLLGGIGKVAAGLLGG
jgi:hypothetical protein